MSRRITGQVLVMPSSDHYDAFVREIDAAMAAGEREQAYGLTIGLALLWCLPVEDLWREACNRDDLASVL